ncbi:MAG TPA: Rieske (2Fe-2S) protein [Candidatus Lustribacter sp.]
MNPEYASTDRPLDAWARNRTLTRIAERIQPVLRNLLESDAPRRRPIKDLLHGTFLGHPLHPLFTDVPIGAWTVTAVCDALELFGIRRYRDTAQTALVIGALGAAGAAVTGLADWSDTKDEPQRLGMLHALLNSAALASYAGSLVARRRGARRLGLAGAFAGYGLMATAAYIGGELSFGMQLGVKHTAVPLEPSPDFARVLDEPALTGSSMHAAETATIPLLVTRLDDRVHAVSGVCTHRGAALAEGKQEGRCVRCPWHGSRFSLEDGRVVEGPATFDLATFDTRVAGGVISARARSDR